MSQTEAAFWVANFKRSKDTCYGYSALVTAAKNASPKMRAQLRENVKRYRGLLTNRQKSCDNQSLWPLPTAPKNTDI
jgi:hypothetical protein